MPFLLNKIDFIFFLFLIFIPKGCVFMSNLEEEFSCPSDFNPSIIIPDFDNLENISTYVEFLNILNMDFKNINYSRVLGIAGIVAVSPEIQCLLSEDLWNFTGLSSFYYLNENFLNLTNMEKSFRLSFLFYKTVLNIYLNNNFYFLNIDLKSIPLNFHTCCFSYHYMNENFFYMDLNKLQNLKNQQALLLQNMVIDKNNLYYYLSLISDYINISLNNLTIVNKGNILTMDNFFFKQKEYIEWSFSNKELQPYSNISNQAAKVIVNVKYLNIKNSLIISKSFFN